MSYDIIGIRHVSNDMGAHMSYDSRKAFWIITVKTPSLLYYYLRNPKPSVLSPDKPQALCIITRETPSLMCYYLINPKSSVLSLD